SSCDQLFEGTDATWQVHFGVWMNRHPVPVRRETQVEHATSFRFVVEDGGIALSHRHVDIRRHAILPMPLVNLEGLTKIVHGKLVACRSYEIVRYQHGTPELRGIGAIVKSEGAVGLSDTKLIATLLLDCQRVRDEP